MRQAAHSKGSQSPSLFPPKPRSPAPTLCDLAAQVSVATTYWILPSSSITPCTGNSTQEMTFLEPPSRPPTGHSTGVPQIPSPGAQGLAHPPALLFPLGRQWAPRAGTQLCLSTLCVGVHPRPSLCIYPAYFIIIYLPCRAESFLQAGSRPSLTPGPGT